MFCIWNFNNLTCILLARVTKHLSICRRSMPSLRRNGAPFSELTVPRLAIPIPFYISYPHMSYQHNLYHLTHVAYQTCSADETFQKISNGVSPETHFQDKGKPSHEVWLLQASTRDLPAMCTPVIFIK